MTDNEKNIKAIVEADEVKYFSSDFFKTEGKKALKAKIKKYGKKGMSEISSKGWKTRRSKENKLSTD